MNRISYSILAGAMVLLAVATRFSNFEDVTRTYIYGHVNFLDPDSYYHLRRLAHFLENFPSIQIFDPLLSWPRGAVVDWLPGLVWFFGLPLKLLGVNDYAGLEWGVQIQVVLWGSLLATAIFLWSRRIGLPSSLQFLSFFIAAISPLLVRHSCLGQVDHHLFESIYVLVSAVFVWEAMKSPSPWPWVIYPLMSLVFLQFSNVNLLVFFIVMGFVSFWMARESSWRNIILFSGLNLCVAFSIVLGPDEGVLKRMLGMETLSAVALTTTGLPVLFRILFTGRPTIRIFAGSLLSIGVVLLLYFYWDSIRYALLHLAGYGVVLENVAEARSLLNALEARDFAFIHTQFSWLFYLVVIGNVLLPIFYWKSNRRLALLLLFFLPFLALSFLQRRFIPLIAPLYPILFVLVLDAIIGRVRFHSPKLIPGALVAFGAVCALAPVLHTNFSLGMSAMHHIDFPIVKTLVEKANLSPEAAWDRLTGKLKVDSGILAHPNLGTALLYLTGLGVSQGTFYNRQDMALDLQIREIESDEDLVAKLKSSRLDYVIVTDDLLYHELLWKRFRSGDFPLKMDSAMAASSHREGSRPVVWDLDAMEQTAWYRLLTKPPSEVQLHFLGGVRVENIRHFYKTAKIFHVP